MASTNKTTYYDLSQYTANDKPTYLVDYNSDMANIDAGIHEVDVKAGTNTTNIGTMTDLQTTEKATLVGAINEVKASTVANATNIASNITNIGTMSSLETTNKNSLVDALNEVINNFKLTDIDDCTVTNSQGYTQEEARIKCAKNSDGSLFKLYGNITLVASAWDNETVFTFSNTGLPTIDTAYTINSAGFGYGNSGTVFPINVTYNTNGTITFSAGSMGNDTVRRFYFPPCLYFNTNFGD